jgi:2-C-methyl-D-erythritol 4-phosphate cytidylyltransferase
VQYWAVIPAAGIGARMDVEVPKQYLKINGKTILEHTLEKFCQHTVIEGIIVVIADNDIYWPKLAIASHPKIKHVVGGIERCDSVLNGLQMLSSMAEPDDWVMVHDAARPCVRKEDINHLIEIVADHPIGGILALPVSDTIKRGNKNNSISTTVDRKGLWHALTPQMFRLSTLRLALSECRSNDKVVTDEAQAIEICGNHPLLIEGHPDNIKVTHNYDLALAELYLQQQEIN